MKPRYYQQDATDAFINCIWNEPGANPVIAMPTGTGKSLTLAMITKRILDAVPSARVMIATHNKDLVDQDSRTLQRYWKQAPYGIYSAGLRSKQSAMPITLGTIQSMVKNLNDFGKQNVMLIDEAHLLSPEEESNYRRAIKHFRELHPTMIVGGLSATPWRMKQGRITDGENPIFTKFCYDITGKDAIVRLIDEGWLIPLVPKHTSFQYDTSKVRIVAGEYNQKQLQEAVNDEKLTYDALQETLQCASARKHIMVFCSGIDHVESVTNMLCAFGEDAVSVHSKMPQGQRDANMDRFALGSARWIVNDGMLTTGVDFPHVDCIVLLRPTVSPGLHVQILGRGTRPFFGNGSTHLVGNMLYDQWGNNLDEVEGRLASIAMSTKQNCLVLDFAGNTEKCGPFNDPRIPKTKGKGTGELPVKICPECGTYVHAAQRFCDGVHWDGRKCTHEFEFHTHLEQTAATTELIVRDVPECHWFPVDRVDYDLHTRPFTPPMMKVHYYCGMRRFSETICIEHQSYAGKVARDWWRMRLPDYPPPPTTHDGLTATHLLRVPTHIYVHTNANGGKYPKVVSASFDGTTPLFGGSHE